ncbi:mannose-1-phosphate guanylyltransferase/mannose-1-phosphate guanylyltransferase/mannose-6-phosphate isomerase [Skermanella aerolata]|nr:mannose-1-phosphate guanylyltransferase/mannose-6-phosphate isomerase [Skermanella aerolata]KJB93432.1 mannose-1-phosphate guanylyltransferase [Skermanella aerolata KACC 11604]HYI69293.1 mannose-1-phosphate guanylyltransferase/mannose-6-phosphate isomerase [Skermanella sp.]
MPPMNTSKTIHPVLLSGGSGSRLWPISRESYPKQLLPLVGERTMLQDTVRRVVGQRFAAPLVICNDEHRFVIAEQLREIAVTPFAIALEPVGRNTAAAAAVAALIITEQDPDALLLLLPADHVIRDGDAFHKAIDAAASAAAAGNLVTFGITPTQPETGYGYIRQGAELTGHGGVFQVDAFVEKPKMETAQDMLAAGGHFWNGGMFLFSAAKLLAEMEKFEPAIVAACRDAISKGSRDLDFFRLDPEAFGRAPSISIDYAVMERTDAAVVVPATIGWTDVGAWSALWDIGAKDEDGNVTIGDVMTEDANNCYIRSEGVLTAVVGLDDVVVVATDDAILVASRDKVQDIKKVVERLKKEGRPEAKIHSRVHRPWGFYQCLHEGERFQVKRLTVKPGATLSLQKHYHRAEHWVVVNGTALVTRDADQVLLRENESIYIPLGAVHRLENPGKVTLNLIEVQSGSYLGEDDIVRLTDTYGRA